VPWFLLIVFLIYGGIHAYALLKAKTAVGFGWGTALVAVPVLLALVLAPVIVVLLERHGVDRAAQGLAWIGFVWGGLLFFFFWTNLLLDAVNLLTRGMNALAGRGAHPAVAYSRTVFLAMTGLAAALGAYAWFEGSRIGVERVRIVTDKLPAGTPRLRIAQISDVHLGLIHRHGKAREIADIIRREEPDILVSTGDLADATLAHLDGLSEIFRDIRPLLGKYAVTGNHEFYAGIDQALAFTHRAGFTVLRNESVTVGNALRIAGVDDPTVLTLGDRPMVRDADVLGGRNPPLFTILLKHRPQVDEAALPLFDLQLSGHTHYGQIFPFRYVVKRRYPYIAGLYTFETGTRLYTSRGTGTWGPPMRFLAPPEVTIVDIERTSEPDEGR
jgi:uncharacterized protein